MSPHPSQSDEPLRIVFAGTPDVALPTLQAIHDSPYELVAVVTREPKRQGRKRVLADSPVGAWAKQNGIELIEADRLTASDLETVGDFDLGVVVAYGAILPRQVLDYPAKGWLNLHFSSLPDLRGAAPVQRAIWRGDHVLGSTVFALDEGMDTGPVASIESFEVGKRPTSGEALDTLSSLGSQQVLGVVDEVASGEVVFTNQSALIEDGAEPSRAPMIMREDAFVDFTGSAKHVDAQVRACTPQPGAWTSLPDGSPLKLLETLPTDLDSPGVGFLRLDGKKVLVGTDEGCLELVAVGPAGKRPMSAADWFRGARLEEGSLLAGGAKS